MHSNSVLLRGALLRSSAAGGACGATTSDRPSCKHMQEPLRDGVRRQVPLLIRGCVDSGAAEAGDGSRLARPWFRADPADGSCAKAGPLCGTAFGRVCKRVFLCVRFVCSALGFSSRRAGAFGCVVRTGSRFTQTCRAHSLRALVLAVWAAPRLGAAPMHRTRSLLRHLYACALCGRLLGGSGRRPRCRACPHAPRDKGREGPSGRQEGSRGLHEAREARLRALGPYRGSVEHVSFQAKDRRGTCVLARLVSASMCAFAAARSKERSHRSDREKDRDRDPSRGGGDRKEAAQRRRCHRPSRAPVCAGDIAR